MTIGSGIAIAGAFVGTALAFIFAPALPAEIFIAPAVASFFIATNNNS